MTCSYSKEFSLVTTTDIENTFITEYLPISSGDTVKVYLYGLFLCNNPELDKSLEEIANTLQLSEDAVLDCFTYWEEFGLVSVLSKNPLSVQYHPVRLTHSVKPRKIKAEKYTDFSKGLQALLPDRMVSTSEYTEYFTIMETYSIKPDAMLMIVKYCTDIKDKNITYRYVSKVAKDFGNRGINTVDKVMKELASYSARNDVVEQILKALSLTRQPEIEDTKLLKKWTQELNFDPENVIFAAKCLKKGSMAKLDAFMMELFNMKSFSREEIAEYNDKKQSIYDLAIKINKAISVYEPVIDTVVDTYTKKWLSYGFLEDGLLYVASHCFKTGKNTLRDMDELIDKLRNLGMLSLSSIGDYFNNLKHVDEFISKMLSVCGLNRRPNDWDRENINVWRNWNFSPDMILEAAKLSAGKSSPIAYMNGVLANWKNNNIFSLENITATPTATTNDSQEAYNREYERRRAIATSRAQKNLDTALSIEEFKNIYHRLHSIEKDLAFAEISNNASLLTTLEEEKANLNKSAKTILKAKGLTLDDLTPKYNCSKCNDTGYVGTKRCDCFDKKPE